MRQLATVTVLFALATPAAAFDHRHSAWNRLLARHVTVSEDGHASSVDYARFKQDREALSAYLRQLSTVQPTEYRGWTRKRRLAFLINAYNAWTVDLVLGSYPELASIKDLGSLFSSPWSKRFFSLLGERRSLDDVEHGLIRKPGDFDEPRIHFAVVCASVGCPMLRPEAYVAERLDAQLEDSMRRFLGDRTRNRFDERAGALKVSKIFDWYEEDFDGRSRDFTSLAATFSAYADVLAESDPARSAIRAGNYRVDFLDYDWSLNDKRR
ncbi:MAG: DUF547 domain-containing protein [Rhodocyclaceae bacterium]|nr:DUF547 domain-containing protein [Rhodocyclaceae bacterium]